MKPCPQCSYRGDAQSLTSHITTAHPDFAKMSGVPQGDKPFPVIKNAPVQRVIQNLDTMAVDAPPRMNPEAVAAENNIILPKKSTEAVAVPDVQKESGQRAEEPQPQKEKDTPAILTYVYEGTHCGRKYDTLEVDVKGTHFVIAMCSGTCRKQIKEMKVAKLL